MTTPNREVLQAILRQDLTAFTQRCFQTVVPGQTYLSNWHIEAITYQLERCRRRAIRRLIITLPPRNLKSICASVAFPAFALGHDVHLVPGMRLLRIGAARGVELDAQGAVLEELDEALAAVARDPGQGCLDGQAVLGHWIIL